MKIKRAICIIATFFILNSFGNSIIAEPALVPEIPPIQKQLQYGQLITSYYLFDESLYETNYTETKIIEEIEPIYSKEYFQRIGVINWNQRRWTWYSERVLPGQGLNIPGRFIDKSGYICDENDYICVASSDLSKGTIIETPFGKQGKVYDCGCASGTIDVYVNW